jgi:hypothetical protein
MIEVPKVQEVQTEEDFQRIVAHAQSILARLKPLDYEALYEELTKLNIKTSENPHIQQLNHDLQAVQACKDRVSEISTQVMRHALTYRRIADLLTEGWPKFAGKGSADQRKAEAALKMMDFENAAGEAEILHKATLGVLKNLDSKHESASRQITCFHLMLKLRDVGRTTPESGFLPEDFGELKSPDFAEAKSPDFTTIEAPTQAAQPIDTNTPSSLTKDSTEWEKFARM